MADRIFRYAILIWSEERVSLVKPFASIYFPKVTRVSENRRCICAGKGRPFKGNAIGAIETTWGRISESLAFHQNRIRKTSQE
jgi:hypothetical protein